LIQGQFSGNQLNENSNLARLEVYSRNLQDILWRANLLNLRKYASLFERLGHARDA
jgi:hypothetical protein